jgi:hypothetical protein
MILTKEYQHIATSSPMYAQSGGYYYYTESYARAIPNESTGIYKVHLKLLLCCSISSQFYQYATTFNGSVDGVSVFAGTNKPWSPWLDKSSIGTYATVISEGSTSVDCANGLEKEITLKTSWKFLGNPADYTPAYGATADVSVNVTLSAIPRASKISELSSSDGTFDGVISYLLTPSSGSMDNRQTVSFNGEVLFEADLGKLDSPKRIEIILDDYKKDIYEAITDTTKVKLSVKVDTYIGDANVGNDYAETEVVIPTNDDTRPTLEGATIFPSYIHGTYFGTSYVKGKTTVGYTASASAKFKATIKGYTVTVDGEKGVSLPSTGDHNISIVAEDSRGISSLPAEFTVKVYDYRVPIIVNHPGETDVLCYRCDDDGFQSDTGANCYLKFTKLFSEIPGNVCEVNYRIRGEGEQWGQYKLLNASDEDYIGILRSVFLNPSKAYHIQLQIIDGGKEFTTKTFAIAADWTDYQYNGTLKSWAFGESVPQNRPKSFSLGLKAYLDKGTQPIPFCENTDIYVTEVFEDELLLPVSALMDFTLFFLRCEGVADYALGVRIGNYIRLIGLKSYIEIREHSIKPFQDDGFDQGADLIITHIYGLL